MIDQNLNFVRGGLQAVVVVGDRVRQAQLDRRLELASVRAAHDHGGDQLVAVVFGGLLADLEMRTGLAEVERPERKDTQYKHFFSANLVQ